MPFRAVPGLLGRGADRGPDGRARRADDLRPRRHRLRALGAGAGLVHVNPHNPLGRVFTVEEQLALAGVVDRHGARSSPTRSTPRWCIRAPCTGPTPPCPPSRPAMLTATGVQGGTCPASRRAQLVLSDAADVAHWARVGFLYGHGASTLGCAPQRPRTTRRRVAGRRPDLPRRQPALLADLLAAQLPEIRATGSRRAPTWPGWTAGGSASPGRSAILPREGGCRPRRRAGVWSAW